ncbi:MAG: hypothetical protein CM1200mP6_00640 [Anaerolineaceae bacterium]|nr:MAG: hypothetical protein CM1200mP6_00640 [Anaerolineaceae bacterium]
MVSAIGSGPQLIGHSSFNWALGYLPVSYVTLAAIGEPVAATALAWIILHESPTCFRCGWGAVSYRNWLCVPQNVNTFAMAMSFI